MNLSIRVKSSKIDSSFFLKKTRMNKKTLLDIVLNNKVYSYIRSGIRIEKIWGYMEVLMIFKRDDHYEFVKKLLEQTDKIGEIFVGSLLCRAIRYKRIKTAKLIIDKFYECNFNCFDYLVVKYDSIELMEYLLRKGDICLDYATIMKYISRRMFNLVEKIQKEDRTDIMKCAIKYGRTEIVKLLWQQGIRSLEGNLSLRYSNAECMKWILGHFEDIEFNIEMISPNIFKDEECIKFLDPDNCFSFNNLVYIRENHVGVLRRFVTLETKDRFDPDRLLRWYADSKKMDIFLYLRGIYGFDDETWLDYVMSHLLYINQLGPLLKDGRLVWKESYKKYINDIVSHDKNLNVLKIIGDKINCDDVDNVEIFQRLTFNNSAKMIRYVVNNYDVDYGKYLCQVPRYYVWDIMPSIFDIIWDPDVPWPKELCEQHDDIIYNFHTKKMTELSDVFYKIRHGKKGVILGGLPRNEYKYVSILECRYPELLMSPTLRRISIWHSGFRDRLMDGRMKDISFVL